MGNLTWCDNCGDVTNNSRRRGGYRNIISCDDVPMYLELCDECHEEAREEFKQLAESYNNWETPSKL